MQFLLALVGSRLGVLRGLGDALALARLAGWRVYVGPILLLVAFAVSTGAGMFVGDHPARRPSRLDPIEALRYE